MSRTFGKFIVAGVINTGTTYVAYLLLLRVLPYWGAYTLSYALGIALGYWLNATQVFGQGTSVRSATLYPLAYVGNYLLGLALLALAVRWLSVPEAIAPLLVLLVTVPVGYMLARLIFRSRT
jgi:putative flippase GtrA